MRDSEWTTSGTSGGSEERAKPHAAPAARTLLYVDGEGALHQLGPGAVTAAVGSRALEFIRRVGVSVRARGLAGARTPAQRTTWNPGGGTQAARLQSRLSGSRATATVPSELRMVFRVYTGHGAPQLNVQTPQWLGLLTS